MEELYDLEADPEELTNLAQRTQQRERLLALRAATIAELKRNDAKIADNLPTVASPQPRKKPRRDAI